MFWRCKEVFRKLNALAHELYEKKLIAEKYNDFKLPVLSKGMTGDYEVEEIATMVRVGTAIFGIRTIKCSDFK